MKRRMFIAGLGSAAAWPLVARAQQPAMPVIGYLGAGTSDSSATPAFHRGLGETGYVEGRNVMLEYRYAEGQYDRLPGLAADLVRRRVSLIAATPSPAAMAAKAATTTIPIVFTSGFDAARIGLVASFSRPGGNVTGISYLSGTLGSKRLELLHQLAPNADLIAMLVNPDNANTQPEREDVETAARTLGQKLTIVVASTESELDQAFTTLIQRQARALLVGADPFFVFRRSQIVALAARHMVPTIYANRIYVDVGGLIAYGANVAEQLHQMGVYAGRILKGEKPADLPVMQPTRFDFVINLKTAKALGLTVPETLLATADQVIE
jgi:putative ABC transport system substrate-binding protein